VVEDGGDFHGVNEPAVPGACEVGTGYRSGIGHPRDPDVVPVAVSSVGRLPRFGGCHLFLVMGARQRCGCVRLLDQTAHHGLLAAGRGIP